MRALRLTVRLRSARVALAVLAVVVVLMVAGAWLAPYDPLHQDTAAVLAGPSAEHWLGTDYVGRDVLSRLLAGSRLSVVAAAEAVGLGLLLGVLPGLASVYLGRVFEWLSLRVMDGLMALPFIIFAIAVAALLGNGLHQAMFAVGVLMAPSFYRVTRAAAIGLRQAQYVEAATLFGATRWRLVRTHVWQKVLPTVVVTAATAMAGALLVVSSLTFLGIGVQPPAPTWGGMLASDLGYLSQRPFGPVAPALLIIVTVAALNALADAIRDATGDGAPASSVPVSQEVLDDVPAARI